MAVEKPQDPPLDEFHTGMKKLEMCALWERHLGRGLNAPSNEPPFLWRWDDVEPLIDQAIAATDMDNAERRVIQMKNPAYPGEYVCATKNIKFGLQILIPGESARPHRHNMNALRFVVEGEGAVTIVDGKRCEMAPGDMILTPGWTWHEHVHEGSDGRVVWLDALDVPLVDYLGAAVFEPGPAGDLPDLPPDSAFSTPGFVPAQVTETAHSPLFRYSWADAVAALAAMPPESDGSRSVRYTDPVTGGAVMSLMDCFLLGLEKGSETRPYRSTSGTACFVAEGEGVSHVGDETIKWQKFDSFTLPAGHWVSHRAETADTKLFQVTDREIMRRLELLRDEFQD